MKISTILDHIDSGHMALPEFQRGYVWNRDQVRALMDSMYRRHPVGSLLVWVTESEDATYRGDGELAPGVVKLLLDGQQRMTTLYGLVRGEPPKFFDGNARAFTGLYFNLESEEFNFYLPMKMKDDPLWVSVTQVLQEGIGPYVHTFSADPVYSEKLPIFINRLNAIKQIEDIDLYIDEVTGRDKSIDIVVDIFNRVNSGGTKLSKGDLALAKISAEWPAARDRMKAARKKWHKAGYHFDLDWLLRNVNTVLTGEAKFKFLHAVTAQDFEDALKRTEKIIDYLLNLIGGRFGLDHNRVLFGRYALPVLSRFVDQRGGKFADGAEQDKALFWYVQSAMWGRFSGQSESYIDQDLSAIENLDGGLDRLIHQLRLTRGDLIVKPDHFGGWSLGARFYPVLYMLTRVGEARDWGTGIALKEGMLGKASRLHVHHIFPKALLYKNKYNKAQVNAIANFALQTENTNITISDRAPEDYFAEVEEKFPGALASQWIPLDRDLWKVDRYLDFLAARQDLLAQTANEFMKGLLHGEELEEEAPEEKAFEAPVEIAAAAAAQVPGGIESDEEEELILSVCDWVCEQGLPEGELLYELTDDDTGKTMAVLDLAWPRGLQEGLSEPVALLINEGTETLAAANKAGFLYFTDVDEFKQYVRQEVLAENLEEQKAV